MSRVSCRREGKGGAVWYSTYIAFPFVRQPGPSRPTHGRPPPRWVSKILHSNPTQQEASPHQQSTARSHIPYCIPYLLHASSIDDGGIRFPLIDIHTQMKYKSKAFSKTAWSSRVTAPLIKVDLTIQCRDLPKKDLLSQADAFCVLWQVPNGFNPNTTNGQPAKLPSRQEIEKGFAKPVKGSVDPVFKDIFRLEFSFHEEQTYIIRVYDEDLKFATALKEHDYLGGCVFTLGQLMGAKGCTVAKRLARDKSYMIITGNGTLVISAMPLGFSVLLLLCCAIYSSLLLIFGF